MKITVDVAEALVVAMQVEVAVIVLMMMLIVVTITIASMTTAKFNLECAACARPGDRAWRQGYRGRARVFESVD